jgi:hypothetical protein
MVIFPAGIHSIAAFSDMIVRQYFLRFPEASKFSLWNKTTQETNVPSKRNRENKRKKSPPPRLSLPPPITPTMFSTPPGAAALCPTKVVNAALPAATVTGGRFTSPLGPTSSVVRRDMEFLTENGRWSILFLGKQFFVLEFRETTVLQIDVYNMY